MIVFSLFYGSVAYCFALHWAKFPVYDILYTISVAVQKKYPHKHVEINCA